MLIGEVLEEWKETIAFYKLAFVLKFLGWKEQKVHEVASYGPPPSFRGKNLPQPITPCILSHRTHNFLYTIFLNP